MVRHNGRDTSVHSKVRCKLQEPPHSESSEATSWRIGQRVAVFSDPAFAVNCITIYLRRTLWILFAHSKVPSGSAMRRLARRDGCIHSDLFVADEPSTLLLQRDDNSCG